MPVRDRWCHHVAPATAVVPCGGEEHRVSWRRGKLKIEDHDLAAERTMIAFGGETPACLQALTLWRNIHSWAMSAHLLQQMQSRLGSNVLLAPGDLRRVNDLGLLLTWDRAWRKSLYYSEHGRLLAERVRARADKPLQAHLRFWMERHGCRRLAPVRIELAKREEHPAVHGVMDGVSARARATLGTRWLVEVAARGIELVGGAFVLEVVDGAVGGDRAVTGVRAVRWEAAGDGTAAAVVAPALLLPAGHGGWSLAWDDAFE